VDFGLEKKKRSDAPTLEATTRHTSPARATTPPTPPHFSMAFASPAPPAFSTSRPLLPPRLSRFALARRPSPARVGNRAPAPGGWRGSVSWFLAAPGGAAARCGDEDLIPGARGAIDGTCPPKPIDLTTLCEDETARGVLGEARFSLENDGRDLFVSNEARTALDPAIAAAGEDARAGGEYVRGEALEREREEADRDALAAQAGAPALVVDGETIPPLGKTKLKPGSRLRIGRVDMAQGGAAVFEVQRVVHAHA